MGVNVSLSTHFEQPPTLSAEDYETLRFHPVTESAEIISAADNFYWFSWLANDGTMP